VVKHASPTDSSSVSARKAQLISSIRSAGVKVISRSEVLRIIIPVKDFFEPYDLNQLVVSKRPTLKKIANLLKLYSGAPIQVVGYTNVGGTLKQEQIRSRRAADVIYAHLWDNGVSERRMTVIGRGPSEPISSAGNLKGWGENRRVEIRVGLPE
jgi:outer membrane protein OmpA-like peptidoglycan-associated protein